MTPRRLLRWAPWALLLGAAVAALVIGATRSGGAPSVDAETMHIASEVRCPVCEGQTAAQSNAPASVQIRDQIHQELAAGETTNQILGGLVAAYGQGILEKPSASGVGLVVWVLPVVIVVVAAGALVMAFRRWRPAREGRGEWRFRGRAGRWALTGVGVGLVAAGAGWAVVGSSATRLPGEEISGAALSPQTEAQSLQAAQAAESAGNYVTAVKDYQSILAADPTQPEALTGEGWVLVQTQQPGLVKQGLTMLASAERASPAYAPAHLYRGIGLISENDNAAAIPELRWYLAHGPDPTLAPRVQQALSKAEAAVSKR